MRYPFKEDRSRALAGRSRRLAVSLETVLAIGSFLGGYRLLDNATNLGVKEWWLRGSPFPDYRVPALFLLVVIGGGMLTAAVMTVRRSRLASAAALAMGGILLAWLVIETAVVGFQGWQQAVLLLVCGLPACALIATDVGVHWLKGEGRGSSDA